jgi:hypothetical protein
MSEALPDMEVLLDLYSKRVMKWRKRAVKAETECDVLRKRNIALERLLYEAGI